MFNPFITITSIASGAMLWPATVAANVAFYVAFGYAIHKLRPRKTKSSRRNWVIQRARSVKVG